MGARGLKCQRHFFVWRYLYVENELGDKRLICPKCGNCFTKINPALKYYYENYGYCEDCGVKDMLKRCGYRNNKIIEGYALYKKYSPLYLSNEEKKMYMNIRRNDNDIDILTRQLAVIMRFSISNSFHVSFEDGNFSEYLLVEEIDTMLNRKYNGEIITRLALDFILRYNSMSLLDKKCIFLKIKRVRIRYEDRVDQSIKRIFPKWTGSFKFEIENEEVVLDLGSIKIKMYDVSK